MKAYIALSLQKNVEFNGHQWPIGGLGVVGCLAVFKTKTAARKMFGKDVNLQQIETTRKDV